VGEGGTSVSIQIGTPEEAERIFNALIPGGRVEMPLQESFWSQRFGMLVDRYGKRWMVNCTRQP
jgi:PhnB protein